MYRKILNSNFKIRSTYQINKVIGHLGLLVTLLLTSLPLTAVPTYLPLLNWEFFGGQYFFEGKSSSFAVNTSLDFTPAIKFSENFSLIPTYQGVYEGIQQVSELIGGDNLFQQSQYHWLNLKAVRRISPLWKLKLRTNYRWELLRETKDEDWGEGLYDTNRWGIGLDAEYLKGETDRCFRLSGDYYQTVYPNYSSLGTSAVAQTLGIENVGADVLDHQTTELGLFYRFPFLLENQNIHLAYWGDRRYFSEQYLVEQSGEYGNTKRVDYLHLGEIGLERYGKFLGWPLGTDLKFRIRQTNSNQNHYDGERYQYIPDYYDCLVYQISPLFTMEGKESPWRFHLGLEFTWRNYSQRLTQDVQGNYQPEKVAMFLQRYSWGMSYPVGKGLRLHLLCSWLDSSSNMDYEEVYSYNYTSSNYLCGFSYEF